MSKAMKMQLGAFLDNGDYITYSQLLLVLKERDKSKVISWIEKRNFPVHVKRVRTTCFRTVKIEEFWKWAKENQDMLDFSKLEENILGKEPEWVKQKRKLDFERNRKYKTSFWTKTEDEQLIFLVRQQKYNCNEISKKLCRTEGAVRRRMQDLGIKDRLLKTKSQAWTEEQKQMVIHLIEKGYSYELIAEQLEKSSKAIRTFIYRVYGTESLDKVRKALKEHEKL